MKRVVVTGASSFIGVYLIQELLKDTENEILRIFKRLAKDENKCIVIVTHSQNVCNNVDMEKQF